MLASFKVLILVACSLAAFAGNSILCRLALQDDNIEASVFTFVRLVAGALMMLIMTPLLAQRSNSCRKYQTVSLQRSWISALMLFVYAACFSYAYVSLDTGVGALVLFGTVQLTMIVIGVYLGHQLSLLEIVGVALAFAGFIYMIYPSLTTPSFVGFVLMTFAGIAWGVYTLMGRNTKNAILDTTHNFIKTIPFAVVLILFSYDHWHLTLKGVLLAVASGALASAMGYSIWYMVLKSLSVTQAAVIQLLVPVLAAIAGVLWAGELISKRLIWASILVLGGVLLVIFARRYLSPKK